MTLSPIIGRYLHISIDGQDQRIYFEEAGQGIPLICQHTAGTDGRQWRHLLEDETITAAYRVIVPDLPYHGKSLPPSNVEWWNTTYRLTTSGFMNLVVGIADTLDLDRPVYLGCSMGGHLAIDLAINHPDRFRAVIGVEAGLVTLGDEATLLHNFHPRVSSEFKAALMYGLTSPTSPEAGRREASWYYLQGAPPAHRGDLYYYVNTGADGAHDVRESASSIDTTRIGVHLMSGEYDWSATTGETRALADQIAGSNLITMPDLGHFPMTENYPAFREHLLRALDAIAGADEGERP